MSDQENIQEITDSQVFLEMMAAHSDDIRVDRITLEITQDLPAAAVLSRLAYWFSPSKKDGQKRTRIRYDGKDWVAKGDKDWWEECGVTSEQMRRIKRLLITLGVIDTINKKFDGNPTTHYHLNIEAYFKLYKETIQKNISNCAKSTKGIVPKAQKETGESHKTITREYKQEIKTKDLYRTMDSGQARILSLFNQCFDFVFGSLPNAIAWLHTLGISDHFIQEITPDLAGQDHLLNLRAAAEYVKNYYLKSMKNGKKCDPSAYFRRTWEEKWYLKKR